MEFYIGGYAQGKLTYVRQVHAGERLYVIDGEKAENLEEGRDNSDGSRLILNHLHLWVKKRLAEGREPEEPVREFVKRYSDCIIISDEIGNGIVPVEQEERAYRERLGRMQTELAAEAERVERVICGLGQRLK